MLAAPRVGIGEVGFASRPTTIRVEGLSPNLIKFVDNSGFVEIRVGIGEVGFASRPTTIRVVGVSPNWIKFVGTSGFVEIYVLGLRMGRGVLRVGLSG